MKMTKPSSAEELRNQWRTSETLHIRDQHPPLPQLEELLREEYTGLERITTSFITGSPNTLLAALKKRGRELVNLNTIFAMYLSKEAQQALFEVFSELNVLVFHFLGEGRATIFPNELANYKLWPRLNSLKSEKISINEQAMKELCESLSQRERPIQSLSVDFEHCSKTVITIFVESIPRIRVADIKCCQIEQDDLCTLCDQLNRCDAVRGFRIINSSHYQWTDRMMEALTKAFQQMPSLESFDLSMGDVSSEEQIFALGRLVASRPLLRSVQTIPVHPLRKDLVPLFFKGCGFHPV